MLSASILLQALSSENAPTSSLADLCDLQAPVITMGGNLQNPEFGDGSFWPVLENGLLIGTIDASALLEQAGRWHQTVREYENLIADAYNPIITIDTNNRIKIFNQAAEKLLYLSSDSVCGQVITDVIEVSRLPEVIETGQTQSTQKVTIGGKVFVSNRAPVYRNGQLSGAIAILQEISELESVSQELEYVRQLNTQMDAIIESSFDGLYITDGFGYTLRVNKGFERITGIPAHEHIGRNMADLVEAGFYSRSATLLALEERKTITIPLDTQTGKTLLVTSNPIFDEDGEISLVVNNVRDLTELNQLQRRLEQAEGLSRLYESELKHLKVSSSGQFIVRSIRMEELLKLAIRLGDVDSTVLITGESGVGKDMIADQIHASSMRHKRPIVKLNCGAIPGSLLESELFGYEPGAFTGASVAGKTGLFEAASGSTLFLDEIGEMPASLQVKLLRVLEERRVRRIGGTASVPVDVRILAGTNRDLIAMVETRQFRKDLYYRLNVVPLHVPPLRERRDDIAALTEYFLHRYNNRYGLKKRLTADVIEIFLDYHWPGNVRELENLVERLVVTTQAEIISVGELPIMNGIKIGSSVIKPLKTMVEEVEKALLVSALEQCRSTYAVARALQVNQSTIVRKLARYGLKTSSSIKGLTC